MTAALILGINVAVAAVFAVAFLVVAGIHPTLRGARWLAGASALGIVNVALEFALRRQDDPTVILVAIFAVFLLMMTLTLAGISSHYRVRFPMAAALGVWILATAIAPLLLQLPYGSGLRAALYQLPYAAMQVLIVVTILRHPARDALDKALLAISTLAVVIYLGKPLIASHFGSAATPQGYITSQYAGISQSLGTVTLIAMALSLLLIMMRDLMAELVVRSETDPLSGLLNRRGFDVHGERLIAEARRAGCPIALVTVDIDHFKRINDRHGHAIREEVIASVARILSDRAPSDAIVARLGGEEFAVILRAEALQQAHITAEEMRCAVNVGEYRGLEPRSVTASFGIAELRHGEVLFSLLRRSDAALYRAKAEGRDVVSSIAMDPLGPLSPRFSPLVAPAGPGAANVRFSRSSARDHHRVGLSA